MDAESPVSMHPPTHIGVRYLRDNMRSLTERMAKGERFVILRHNRPVGALIPYEDFFRLTKSVQGPGQRPRDPRARKEADH